MRVLVVVGVVTDPIEQLVILAKARANEEASTKAEQRALTLGLLTVVMVC